MADRAESGYLDNEGETDFQVAKTFPPTVRPGEVLLWKQVWLDSLWIRLVLTFISPSGALNPFTQRQSITNFSSQYQVFL